MGNKTTICVGPHITSCLSAGTWEVEILYVCFDKNIDALKIYARPLRKIQKTKGGKNVNPTRRQAENR